MVLYIPSPDLPASYIWNECEINEQMHAVLQSTPVRIVVVSSTVHRHGGFDIDDLNFRHRSYSGMAAYAQSKLCNILFTKELANK